MAKSDKRWKLFSAGVLVFAGAFLTAFFATSIFSPVKETSALDINESASVDGYNLSLSVPSTVTLNLGVVNMPVMTVVSELVSVETSAPNGYKLYLSMANSSNSLIRSGESDALTSGGTVSAPEALSTGKWGYAFAKNTANVVSNNFDTSYETMQDMVPTGAKFAAIPTTAEDAQLIASSNAANAGSPDEIPIYFGAVADPSTSVGAYTGTVVYTALANAGSSQTMTVSPNSGTPAGGTAITITTNLFSTANVGADVYMLTTTQYNDVAANPGNISNYSSAKMTCNRVSGAKVIYTCTTPAKTAGSYKVYVDVPRYDDHYSADFTYEDPSPLFYTISNMQQMTNSVCASVNAPTDSSVTTLAQTASQYLAASSGTVVPEVTLTDTRGSTPYKTYRVRKLADGRCWMVDNLALQSATLNSTNSNLPSGKTVNLPASSTANWCTTNSDACMNQLMTLSYADAGSDTSGHPEYGNYYNWYTATATYGTRAETGDTSYSICPLGWRLPKGGSSGEFQTLYSKYNSSASLQTANTFNALLAGRRYGSSTNNVGSYGYFWSSTGNPSNSNFAYDLYLYASNVYPADYNCKYFGFSVRCIADQ